MYCRRMSSSEWVRKVIYIHDGHTGTQTCTHTRHNATHRMAWHHTICAVTSFIFRCYFSFLQQTLTHFSLSVDNPSRPVLRSGIAFASGLLKYVSQAAFWLSDTRVVKHTS